MGTTLDIVAHSHFLIANSLKCPFSPGFNSQDINFIEMQFYLSLTRELHFIHTNLPLEIHKTYTTVYFEF